MLANQFLFTKQILMDKAEGKKLYFGPFRFYYYKGVIFTQVENSMAQVLVAGNLYDYENPLWGNREIIESWLKDHESFDNILKATFKYSRQYLVFYRNKQTGEAKVFTDTAAQYELYYTRTPKGDVVASSGYRLIERITPLHKDTSPEAIEFYSSTAFQKRLSFVGEDTNFTNLKRLKPNYYLDLNKGKTVRYFPESPLKTTTLEEASQKCAEMLKGYITAAANRQPLLIPLTAGWDSRVILAASRDILNKSIFYVLFKKGIHPKYDKIIPERLSKLFKFRFYAITTRDSSNKEVDEYAKEHVLFPKVYIYKRIREFYSKYPEYLILNGNVSEIARLEFDEVFNLSPEKIAWIEKYPFLDYALLRLTKWYEDNKTHFATNGYRVLDMLYWEENCANWVAKFKTEYRLMGYEMFSLFNSRELLLTLYGLPKKYRRKQNPVVYKRMIQYLWPEILRVPVNPGIKKIAMRLTQKIGIFPVFRNMKLWCLMFLGKNK